MQTVELMDAELFDVCGGKVNVGKVVGGVIVTGSGVAEVAYGVVAKKPGAIVSGAITAAGGAVEIVDGIYD